MKPLDSNIAELLLEWETCRSQGNSISIEDFCRGRAGINAEELYRRIHQLEAINGVLDLENNLIEQSSSNTREAPLLPGYHLERELGCGGMGVVYVAMETSLQRRVAIKVLPQLGNGHSAEMQRRERRFTREAQSLAKLRHPNIVPIYAGFLQEGTPFFVMELMSGGSLADCLNSEVNRSPIQVVELMEKVVRAVEYAHQQKIVHRDLKPANVLLDDKGEPRVSDFGLAKIQFDLDANSDEIPIPVSSDMETVCDGPTALTLPGMEPGTPPYMAPEQYDAVTFGPITVATDVWALGVIMYELLTGQRPFSGLDRQSLRSQVCQEAPPPPRKLQANLNPKLAAIVMRCLEKQSSRRFSSADALAGALARYRQTQNRKWRAYLLAPAVLLLCLPWMMPAPAQSTNPTLLNENDKYDLSVQPMLDELRNGRAVDLIPESKPPRAYFLREGAGALEIKEDAATNAFVAVHPSVAFIELLPEVPCNEYIIRADIRHEYLYTTKGRVGVYFAYSSERQPKGLCHSYISLGLVDPLAEDAARPKKNTSYFTVEQVCYGNLRTGSPRQDIKVNIHEWEIGPKAIQSGQWHTLVVKVQPKRIQVSFDDKPLQAFDHILAEKLFRDAISKSRSNLSTSGLPLKGAIGLSVFGGSITVRKLRLEPLP